MVLKLTDDTVERAPLLSLSEGREAEYTPGYVGELASKLHIALGEGSPGEKTLKTSYTTGASSRYKQILAEQERLRTITARNDVLSSISDVDPEMITPEMIEVTQGLSLMEIQSPDLTDIVERRYAQLYTNMGAAYEANEIVDQGMDENPEATVEVLDRLETVAYKNNMIATKAGELSKLIENQSWGSYVWDFTERVIPFVDWYQKTNQVGRESEFVSSVLPGNNLIEQYAYLWNLPAEQFRVEVDRALEDLKSRNYQTAMSWLDGMKSYGSSDAFLDNAFAVLDVADVSTLGMVGVAKGLARGSIKAPRNLPEIATAAGRYEDGAVGKISKEIEEGSFFGGDSIRNMDALEESVPSLTNPGMILRGSRDVPKEAYLRMKETLTKNSELARQFILEPNLVDRLNPEELLNYKDVLRTDYVRQHPSIQKNVIDVEILPNADVGNVYNAQIVLGKRDGTLFESERQARNYFDRYIGGTSDYEIQQIGQGYRIAITRSVNENQLLTDAFRLGTDQTTPESFANTFGGWFRSSNYVISDTSGRGASTAVTTMERMKGIFEEMAQPLTSLPRNQMDELNDLMVVNRQQQEYYESYGAFSDAFFDRFKKNPTTEQTEAYFTYVQMNDLDLVIRDLDWYKQKAVQGREEITLRMGDEDLSFEGRVVESLPNASSDITERYRFTIIRDGVKDKTRSSMGVAGFREEIAKLQEQGYKIFQVANQALKIGEKEYTGFVITNSAQRNRVGVKNVDRRAGGHKVDTYKGYIKQGQVARTQDGSSALYRGDLTMFGVKTQKEGEDFVRLLNEGRERMLRNEPDAYRWIRDNLPIDSQRFVASVKAGEIDLTVPFSYTPKGVRTVDTGALAGIEGLEDVGRNVHNLDSQILGRYSGSRDMSEIDVVRSEGDMKFEIRGAEYLDPISTLRMSSQNVISQRAMNDYSIMSTRNFIREFGDILQGTTNELMAQGTQVLTSPRFLPGVEQTQAPRVAAAQNVSRAYRNLMNHGTALDRKIDAYKDKLIGSISPKLGPRGQQWLDERSMFNTTNPGVYLRSIGFHTKLGLFNPNQLFIQANALVNVASVGGLNGMRGGLSYPLMRAAMLTNNPEIINRIANISKTTGVMSADQFKESLALYKRSGYNSVGKDTAFLDDVSGPEINTRSARGMGAKFLDYGTTPFREGERVVRMAAWQTAYLEKRQAVGSRALTRRDEADILQRAKLLAVDMTREANASWQKGYAAVFSQFFSFQARLTEQFLGKRLTPAEKARLFVGYSAMYGVPTATGAAVGVLPFRDMFLDQLYGMGIDPSDENWRPFVDGFANMLIEQITGKDLNIADRYGAGGMPMIYDLIQGDQTLLETLVGASGSIFGEVIRDGLPFLHTLGSEIGMFGDEGLYRLTKEDMIAPFRNISSINNAFQIYQVQQLGVWASRNEVNLIEMDLPDAVVAALTGLQPSELGDTFRRSNAMRSWKEEKEALQKELTRNYVRILRMDPGPEREMAVRRNLAEMQLGGFSPEERWQIYRDARRNNTVSDSVWERWDLEARRKRRREESRQ